MEENTSYKKYKVQIINKNEEEDYKLILRNEDDPTESKLSIILQQGYVTAHSGFWPLKRHNISRLLQGKNPCNFEAPSQNANYTMIIEIFKYFVIKVKCSSGYVYQLSFN